MTKSNGRQGNLYEQVLDYARREIDEASSKIEELRRTLRLLEARVEAAKSVYEAVAARLNLEDELEEEAEFQEAPYPDVPPLLQEPEPLEDTDVEEASDNGARSGFSMDLIRQHLEERVEREEEDASEASEPAAAESNMDLIRQHLEERVEREEEDASEASEPAAAESNMDLIRQHLEERVEREEEVASEASEPAAAESDMDLIRRHFEQKVQGEEEDASEASEPAAAESGGESEFPELSAEDRRLIGEHLRRRAEAEQEE